MFKNITDLEKEKFLNKQGYANKFIVVEIFEDYGVGPFKDWRFECTQRVDIWIQQDVSVPDEIINTNLVYGRDRLNYLFREYSLTEVFEAEFVKTIYKNLMEYVC